MGFKMIELKVSNIEEIIRLFKNGSEAVLNIVNNAVLEGLDYFGGAMVKEQMTGRPGLRRQTGTLARSWKTYAKSKGIEGFIGALGTEVTYARVHQGEGGRSYSWRSKTGKLVTMPKRLFIYEEYDKRGFLYITQTVLKKLSKLIEVQ